MKRRPGWRILVTPPLRMKRLEGLGYFPPERTTLFLEITDFEMYRTMTTAPKFLFPVHSSRTSEASATSTFSVIFKTTFLSHASAHIAISAPCFLWSSPPASHIFHVLGPSI
uniref:Uncharacterized protein n=1 Tax=Coccidioides posadasii RMSCC 3488 TaxID=454284 RepID=A0A0J6FEJ1_COCPO|nr:hypothetical protein CPAG_07882 [Coccidioides posadasii RMSCC 3488]